VTHSSHIPQHVDISTHGKACPEPAIDAFLAAERRARYPHPSGAARGQFAAPPTPTFAMETAKPVIQGIALIDSRASSAVLVSQFVLTPTSS
jgi:hypothetical protein